MSKERLPAAARMNGLAQEWGSRAGMYAPPLMRIIYGKWPLRRWYLAQAPKDDASDAWITDVEGDKGVGAWPRKWRSAVAIQAGRVRLRDSCEAAGERYAPAAAYRLLGRAVMVATFSRDFMEAADFSDELTAVMRIGPDPPKLALGGIDMDERTFTAMNVGAQVVDTVRQPQGLPLTETYMREQTPYGQAVLL